MARRRARNDQRANLRGKGFAAIPHVVMESAAWRHTSLRGRCILLEIVKRHNGYNNGRIAMSQRDMSEAIGSTSFPVISRATAELMQHGFVDLEWEGNTWARKAREFRISWLPTGEPPHLRPATDDWKAFSGADTVSAAKAKSADTVSAARRFPADAVSAAKERKRHKTAIPENRPAYTVSAHICTPYRPAAELDGKQGDDPPSTPSESLPSAAADRSGNSTKMLIEQTTAAVRDALLARRASKGLLGLCAVAQSAGVSVDRLTAFIEGRDGLNGPSILRLNRELRPGSRAAA